MSIAESETVISRHKLLFPSISGWMVVIPCEERGITCEARGTTCEARGITAPGALPYGLL